MKKHLITLFSILGLSLILAAAAAAQTVTVSKKQADKPVKILNKPVVRFGRCDQTSGRTVLRVTFDQTAKITDTKIVTSSGCEDFDQNAIKAALGIKFKPAVKDGEAITVTKPVEYSFARY
jgi:TonB family protein